MKRLLGAAVLLLIPCLCWADITFDGPAEVEQYAIAKVRAKSPDYKSFIYKVYGPDGRRIAAERGEGGWLLFTGAPGKYRVEAVAGKTDKDGNLLLDEADHLVTIKGKSEPLPPVPPGPGPGPKPPDPAPSDDAPIKAPGFRVLIVYESADLPKLPPKKLSALYSRPVRDYLAASCAKDADNPQGAYRVWDKDVDATAESKPWQDALKRPRTSLPWVVVSNGRTGWEGPLPDGADELLAVLKKVNESKAAKEKK